MYAIIYGFSQDGETRFTGSLQYLADWTNSTKQSCIKCLKSLVEKGYIIKHEKIVNGAGNSLKKFASESSRSSNTFRDKWSRSFNDIGRSSEKMTSKMLSSIKRITVAWLSVQSTVKATKSIIEAGINIQNSRMYIDAVFGKSNALQKFRQAQDFAAHTPFNSVDITNAIAKAQMLGLGTSKADMDKYADLGSIAKLNGSGGIAEAVDAYADMMNGEFERMQTILGIKKRDLEQYAKDNNMGRFTNKQGQITNKDTLKQVFDSYIQSRGITGITEKYSQTLEGRLSTLSDNFKTSLAKIGGIQDDGSVKAGSLFDNFSKGVERLITSLEKFGQSEAFNVLQENLGKISGAFIDFIDSLTADPKKLQEIFDSIKNIVKSISDIGKFIMNFSMIMPSMTKVLFAYKYGWKPLDFVAKNMAGFKLKDLLDYGVARILFGILPKNSKYGKASREILDEKYAELHKNKKNGEVLNKKNGVVFNKSIFDKAIFNSAKFIGTKDSPFGNGSKKKKFKVRSDERASELSRYVKNDLIPYTKHEIKPYHTKIDIKSGVNAGIKKSGLLSIIRKLSSKLSTIGFILSSAKDTFTYRYYPKARR